MDIKIRGESGEDNIDINKEKIHHTIHSDDFSFAIRNKEIQFAISRSQNLKNKVNIVILEKQMELSNLVLNYFNLSELVYAKRDDFLPCTMQNNTSINLWKSEKLSIPEPMEYISVFDFSDPNKKELSIEHIPRHSHHMRTGDELIFEASWQMYFSEIYYKYIPKPLFDAFDDGHENIINEKGIRKITLYENVTDYNKPKNISIVWAFRRKLGIDSIAHELTKARNRIEPADLPVLITKQSCQKGATRVTRFLSADNILVPPTKAVKKEVSEYEENGINLVLQEIQML